MIEPTIICPKCKTEILLTESLAAPLVEATRQQFEEKLSKKDEEIAQREQVLRDKEKQVSEAKRTLEQQVSDQVAEQLKAERQRVIEEESKKAKQASAAELESKDSRIGRSSRGSQILVKRSWQRLKTPRQNLSRNSASLTTRNANWN